MRADPISHDLLTMHQSRFDHDDSRRDFLHTCFYSLAGVTLIAGFAPLISGCDTNAVAPVDKNFTATYDVSALDADGKAMVTATSGADGTPIILVRTTATTFVALSMYCTHEGCQVDPPRNGTITCSCHGSLFDLEGNVTRGPASTPLFRYNTTYNATNRTLLVSAS